MLPRLVIPVIVVVMLSGCAGLTPPARQHVLAPGSAQWFDYDASRRGAILIPRDDKQRYVVCSEPAPDVALEVVNKLEGKLKATDIEIADGKGEIAVSAIKLAERTQMVMFLRESLYRLCEMSVNNSFQPNDAKEMYMAVVNAALEMVRKDRDEVKQETAKAEARGEKARSLNSLIERGIDKQQIERYLRQQ